MACWLSWYVGNLAFTKSFQHDAMRHVQVINPQSTGAARSFNSHGYQSVDWPQALNSMRTGSMPSLSMTTSTKPFGLSKLFSRFMGCWLTVYNATLWAVCVFKIGTLHSETQKLPQTFNPGPLNPKPLDVEGAKISSYQLCCVIQLRRDFVKIQAPEL